MKLTRRQMLAVMAGTPLAATALSRALAVTGTGAIGYVTYPHAFDMPGDDCTIYITTQNGCVTAWCRNNETGELTYHESESALAEAGRDVEWADEAHSYDQIANPAHWTITPVSPLDRSLILAGT
jgi:hypothetical protein